MLQGICVVGLYELRHLQECEPDNENHTVTLVGETIPTIHGPFLPEYIIKDIEIESEFSVQVSTENWVELRGTFSWAMLIGFAIFGRIMFEHVPFFGCRVPGSVVEIGIGLLAAIVAEEYSGSKTFFEFDAEQFFLYILPWIIFEAGWDTKTSTFLKNTGTIGLHAFIGTAMNFFIIGYLMYEVAQSLGIEEFRVVDGLLFGSFIAAVDPVAGIIHSSQVIRHYAVYTVCTTKLVELVANLTLPRIM